MFVVQKVNKWKKGKKVMTVKTEEPMNMEKTDEFIIKKVKQVMKD